MDLFLTLIHESQTVRSEIDDCSIHRFSNLSSGSLHLLHRYHELCGCFLDAFLLPLSGLSVLVNGLLLTGLQFCCLNYPTFLSLHVN